MANLPSNIKTREELDCRLGIKSSLAELSSVISLCYALYCANNKQSEIVYADEISQSGKKRLVIKEIYADYICNMFGVSKDILNTNPLLTSQLEALQVGLGLMFKIGKISYVDYPNTDTKERTGGERFRKLLQFATNIKIIDVYLSSWSHDEMASEMCLWLKNQPSESTLSKGLMNILTMFSEETQFKLRSHQQDIIFQQSGIYDKITSSENVIAKDEQEDVGPFRVFKSFVREGLHPFLKLGNNEFSCNQSTEFENYKKLVETSLALSPKKLVIYNEIPEPKERSNFQKLESRQIIYYGAPGTGKSHRIKEQLGECFDTPEEEKVPKANIFRTTFHPDSDYSTFVGAYKPVKDKKPLYGLNGSNTVRLKDGEDLSEDIITYKFVAQAFLKAYIRAYEKPDENVYLVIEEINRGNCAQIFGDLFQLLDRDENGKSDYTIKADDDLKNFLEEEFKRIGIGNEGIADGELCLPSNLYIYATMNTSDQSLFPIDSAFKRRWDWEYEPIKYNHDLIISIGDIQYKWTSFQKEVNKRIKDATSSEDKMLGDYFVNPSDGVIDENTLRNKILFYLWNDVCKDGEGDIFKTSETQELTFSDLYGEEGTDNLIAMMEYLGIEEYEEDTETDVDENEGTLISQGSKSADINKVQFSFNEYKKIADGVGQNINADKLFFRNGIDVAFQGKKLNANPRLCLTMDKSKTRSQAEVKLWIPSIYKKKEELFAF